MIDIRPDPARRHGGAARLSVPGDVVSGDTVSVSVRNSYTEQYLGPDGWQPGRERFGPYPIIRESDRAAFVVGAEIVNQIEEYTPLEITVDEQRFETAWPDDILSGPADAVIGGIMSMSRNVEEAQSQLVGKIADQESVAEPEIKPEDPELEEADTEVVSSETVPLKGGNRAVLGLAAMAVVVATGALIWWLVLRNEEPASTSVTTVKPAPTTQTAGDGAACDLDAMLALVGGFDAQLQAMQGCMDRLTPDDALGVIEAGVARNDGGALIMLGRLYDGEELVDSVENELGLSFSDAPARAAEYYSRARSAGVEEAAALLAATCDRLSTATDALSRSATEDFCQ